MIVMRDACISGWPGAIVIAALILASAAATAYAEAAPTMLEETADPPYALAATLQVEDPEALHVGLFVDYTDAENTYVITCTPDEVHVERVLEGEVTRIGASRTYESFQADTALELTVRRDGWRIEFILDQEVLARAWDSELPPGRVGHTAVGGQVVDTMIQPLAGIYMTDDFMREAETQSVWVPAQGEWSVEPLRTDAQSERMEVDKSANAFTYVGQAGEEPAIVTAGYWFWNDYQLSAAVRPVETDPLGLIAYYQDPDNYLLARWTSALSREDDADRLQLISVVDGERSVLAETRGGHIPGQWYAMQLRVCDGLIQCLVDDEPMLIARADLFGQGQPGLYCEGEAPSFFDSVLVEDWEVLSEAFEIERPGKWVAESGTWQVSSGSMESTGSGLRMVTGGRAEWEKYWCEAEVGGRAAVGIAVCVDESSWYGLRFGTQGSGVQYEGEAQIVRASDDGVEVLASAPAFLPAGESHRIRFVVDDGLITGHLNGRRVLDAFDAGAQSGRIGLIADGNGVARFDRVYLTMLPPMRIARVTDEFAEEDAHPEMAEWASTRAPWLRPGEDGEPWWTKGQYFGDKTIAFEVPDVAASEGEVTVMLEACPDEPSTGITLTLRTEKDSAVMTATLKAAEETLGEKQVEVTQDPCPVRFERKGTWIVVSVDGEVIFSEKR